MAKWINSQGGPYILGDIESLASWQGISGCSISNDDALPISDYQRARLGSGYVRVIKASNERDLLIINDLPNDLMLYQSSEEEAILVKWIGAESDDQIITALNAEKEFEFVDQGIVLEIANTSLSIFDAAFESSYSIDNKLSFTLRVGNYKVGVLEYQPNDDLMLQLFQIKLISQRSSHS